MLAGPIDDTHPQSPGSGLTDRRFDQIGDAFVADDLRQMQLARRSNDWLAGLVLPYVGSRVLEVGAGIGNMTCALLERAAYVCALEPNEWCFRELVERHGR